MRQMFYQANFCAECGNALPAQRVRWRWGPRYFCPVCAQRQRSPLYRWLLPLAAILATLGWAFVLPESAPPPSPPAPAVTALNATAQPLPDNPPPAVQVSANAFCGARTRRGTPCRRLVQPGQRCAQHRGQPSLLEEKKAQ
ncbi:MAG: hypothetical protein HYR56_01270 [Acidobacteria bacterium]|nr:hypothetical protein [Acidobacteriota bacterium]MBI3426245.1 hypothetical protein [Acidobacteriota bacterium]